MSLYLLNDMPSERQLAPEQPPEQILAQSPEELAQQLKQAINQLKSDFYDLKTGGVNYAAMKDAEVFAHYRASVALLPHFDLAVLQTQASRLAFWINLYNALTVHGIVALGVKQSVREIPHFFEKVAYRIGAHTFSLDQIEHGILRGNAKKHFLSHKPFSTNDPRMAYVLTEREPRIHFALVCGSKSCPPISTYQAEKIETQLQSSAASFVNSDHVRINREQKQLHLSKLFAWYGQDFGDRTALIRFLAHYRKDSEEKAFLLEHGPRLAVSYQKYDWRLNH